MNKLLKVACMLAASTVFAANAQDLRLGVEPGYAPFEVKTPEGKLAGFDIDLGNELCKRIAANCTWVEGEFDGLIPSLKAKKIDAILSSMSITEQRQKEIDFTDKLYGTPARLVAASGSTLLPTAEALKGKQVGVFQGTTAETYFAKNHPNVKLLKFDQYTETYNALLDGRGDAFSTDNTEVLAWAKQNPSFAVGIPSLGDLDTIAPAVQKGNASLLNWLNDEIKVLGKEKFFHTDYDATLKAVYGTSVDPESLVVEGGVVNK